MLVARESFVADYDGVRVSVHRGTTRIAPTHELARRFPDRFESLDVEDRGRFEGGVYRMADGRSLTDDLVLDRLPEHDPPLQAA